MNVTLATQTMHSSLRMFDEMNENVVGKHIWNNAIRSHVIKHPQNSMCVTMDAETINLEHILCNDPQLNQEYRVRI